MRVVFKGEDGYSFLWGVIAFSFLFFFTFSGDGEVYGVNLFFISAFALLPISFYAYFMILDSITIKHFAAAAGLLIVLMLLGVVDFFRGEFGFFGGLWQAQLFLFVIMLFPVLLLVSRSRFGYLGFCFTGLIVFLFFVSLILNFGDGRNKVVFGPNVQYRVLTFCLLFSLIYLTRVFSSKVFMAVVGLIVFILYFAALEKTGSRGGLVSFAFLLFAIFLWSIKAIGGRAVLLFVLCILLFLLFFSIYNLEFLGIQSRLLDYSSLENLPENSSIGLRVAAYRVILEDPSVYLSFTGIGALEFYELFGRQDGFKYPHNLILEFVYFYGGLGLLLVLIGGGFFFSSLYKYFRQGGDLIGALLCSILVLIPGVSFSGSIVDNIAFLGLTLLVWAVAQSSAVKKC